MTTTVQLTHLRCEHLTNPLGLDILQPRLSWILETTERGQRQTAYQVLVSTTEQQLADNHGDLWDSGKVESDRSIHIPYNGKALKSGQRCWWNVRVWDKDGQLSAYSASAWWEMGLLHRDEWRGQWIGGMLAGGPHTTSPAPFLRTQFTLNQPVVRARLYSTALGLYEPHLNGQVVGDDVFTPGWTDYSTRVQYQVYDVTHLLHLGDNVLGAVLGDGWYCGYVGWVERQRYGDRPRFLAQLVVTYEDGSTTTIATDKHWKHSYGPVLETDMIMGESYDARRELNGWDVLGYDDGRWLPVELFADPGIALTAMRGPTVKRIMELKPVAEPQELKEGKHSKWIFDLGQNMVGRLRLRVSGQSGTTVTLRHAEMLNPDGTLYTANLRTAKQSDHYTLKGEDEEVWEPRFTFHGFRYVELSGYPNIPTRETITGIVLHSDMAQTGYFACSDPLITQLQHNIEWGQRGNFVDVPTDCPQRNERLGWTGDTQVFARTAAFNMDVAGFFAKWTRDMEDEQLPDGAYPMVVPNPVIQKVDQPLWPDGAGDGGPAWADAGIIVPLTIYQVYGDIRILEERYISMCRYVEFLNATSRDGLRCYEEYEGWNGYGDWLAIDGSIDRVGLTPKELIGTAFFSHSARLLARIARLLSRMEDAARYDSFADRARNAFCRRYVTSDGRITDGTQTAYVLALHFDLLPEHARETAVEALVHDIEERGMHLSTGFVGTPYINHVLSENGRIDVAYALLKQTTWPSWLYSVTQGATTIWERWDGWTHDKGFQDPAMNSFNHYAYGAIGEWLYKVIGGIDLDADSAGYKHIRMRPQIGGGITHSTAEFHSAHGVIRSTWSLEQGTLNWKITVPANTTAMVYVPSTARTTVRETGAPAEEAFGVRYLHSLADATVYAVDSGYYHFTAAQVNG